MGQLVKAWCWDSYLDSITAEIFCIYFWLGLGFLWFLCVGLAVLGLPWAGLADFVWLGLAWLGLSGLAWPGCWAEV